MTKQQSFLSFDQLFTAFAEGKDVVASDAPLRTQIANWYTKDQKQPDTDQSGWKKAWYWLSMGGWKLGLFYGITILGVISAVLLSTNLGMFGGQMTALGWVDLIFMSACLLVALWYLNKPDALDLNQVKVDHFWSECLQAYDPKQRRRQQIRTRIALTMVVLVAVLMLTLFAMGVAQTTIMPFFFPMLTLMIAMYFIINWVLDLFPSSRSEDGVLTEKLAVLKIAESVAKDLENGLGAFSYLDDDKLGGLRSTYKKQLILRDVLAVCKDDQSQSEGKKESSLTTMQSPNLPGLEHAFAPESHQSDDGMDAKRASQDSSGSNSLPKSVIEAIRQKNNTIKKWRKTNIVANFLGLVNAILVNSLISLATTFGGMDQLLSLLLGQTVQPLPLGIANLSPIYGVLLMLVAIAGMYSSYMITRKSIIAVAESVIKSHLGQSSGKDDYKRQRYFVIALTVIFSVGLTLLTWFVMQSALVGWGVTGGAAMLLNTLVCFFTLIAVAALFGNAGIRFMRAYNNLKDANTKGAIKKSGMLALGLMACSVVTGVVLILGLGMPITTGVQWVVMSLMVAWLLGVVVLQNSQSQGHKNRKMKISILMATLLLLGAIIMIELGAAILPWFLMAGAILCLLTLALNTPNDAMPKRMHLKLGVSGVASLAASMGILHFAPMFGMSLTATMIMTAIMVACSMLLNGMMFFNAMNGFERGSQDGKSSDDQCQERQSVAIKPDNVLVSAQPQALADSQSASAEDAQDSPYAKECQLYQKICEHQHPDDTVDRPEKYAKTVWLQQYVRLLIGMRLFAEQSSEDKASHPCNKFWQTQAKSDAKNTTLYGDITTKITKELKDIQNSTVTPKALKQQYHQWLGRFAAGGLQMRESTYHQINAYFRQNLRTLQKHVHHDASHALLKQNKYKGTAEWRQDGTDVAITRQWQPWMPEAKSGKAKHVYASHIRNDQAPANYGQVAIKADTYTVNLLAGGAIFKDETAKTDDEKKSKPLLYSYTNVAKDFARAWHKRYQAASETGQKLMAREGIVMRFDSLLTDNWLTQRLKKKEYNMVQFFKRLKTDAQKTALKNAFNDALREEGKSFSSNFQGLEVETVVTTTAMDLLRTGDITKAHRDAAKIAIGKLAGIFEKNDAINNSGNLVHAYLTGPATEMPTHQDIRDAVNGLYPADEKTQPTVTSDTNTLNQEKENLILRTKAAVMLRAQLHKRTSFWRKMFYVLPLSCCVAAIIALKAMQLGPSFYFLGTVGVVGLIIGLVAVAAPNIKQYLTWTKNHGVIAIAVLAVALLTPSLGVGSLVILSLLVAVALCFALRDAHKFDEVAFSWSKGLYVLSLLSLCAVGAFLGPEMLAAIGMTNTLMVMTFVALFLTAVLIGWDYFQGGNPSDWLGQAKFLIPAVIMLPISLTLLSVYGATSALGVVCLLALGLGLIGLLIGIATKPVYDNDAAQFSAWLAIVSPTYTGCKTARDRMGLFTAMVLNSMLALKGKQDPATASYLTVTTEALGHLAARINHVFSFAGFSFGHKTGGNSGERPLVDAYTRGTNKFSEAEEIVESYEKELASQDIAGPNVSILRQRKAAVDGQRAKEPTSSPN